jgi:phospholipid/cholesterol/gamma-HCH transport system permease protein
LSDARVSVAKEAGATVISLTGTLQAKTVAPIWQTAINAARGADDRLVFDLGGAEALDITGAALLFSMERAHQGAGPENDVEWRGLTDKQHGLINRLRRAVPDKPLPKANKAEGQANRAGPGFGGRLVTRITFFGQTVLAAIKLPAKLRFLRAADFSHIAESAGYRAVPLIAMLGFLIGMILAFQSSIPMQQFGAVIYVANLVSISMFRELGPLLCATILAGRTGSAFAAELGTMTLNEEIAALTTMGIDSETMLVLPRIAAAMLVMPALTVLMDIAALVGTGAVLDLMGYPPTVVLTQIISYTTAGDFFLGLIKSVVFGAAVGVIGCRAGLTAGGGPRAVGEAATTAVVGGIVAIVLLDGLFAVMTYRMGV